LKHNQCNCNSSELLHLLFHSYLTVFLAFLSVSNAFVCLHHMCSAAFKACNHTAESHDDTMECHHWADETFHCCHECENCDTASTPKSRTDECNEQFCDKVFNICSHFDSNSSYCTEIADNAAHCCYSCLDCPSSNAKATRTKNQNECNAKFCTAVFKACKDSDNPHIECGQIADEASGCCDACDTCEDKPSEDNECAADMCNKIYNTCTHVHPQNSSQCCERADAATHCCYNCIDCASSMKPPKPRYDHCLTDLCNDVYLQCIDTDRTSDKCRKMANHASECCDMCSDCISGM